MDILGIVDINGWIILLLLILSAIYWYIMTPHHKFTAMGVPGPKPYPILGQTPYFKKGIEHFDMECVKNHGKIVGTFAGSMSLLLVADPDLIKQVCVKDTEHFTNRFVFDFGDKIFNRGLSVLKGEEWKRIRNILTPTFSASKMKKMMPLISSSTSDLVDNVLNVANKGGTFEGKEIYGKFTMDVIAKTMFGLEIGCQKGDTESEFVKYAKGAFDVFTGKSLMFQAIVFFPRIVPLLKMLGGHLFDPKMIAFFVNSTKEVIELRKHADTTKYNDFIQLMLNAHSDEELLSQKEAKVKGLTDTEILAQSLIFFLAGYETTASLLSWTSYCLAANPHVQDKLRQEIIEKLGDKELITYEDVHDLPYLDMVINETLRMHPPITRFDRQLNTDGYELGGYKLWSGVDVQVPVYFMHHNEEWWDEPFEFKPERFSADEKAARSPYVFLPFGVGPRNCIGMRFVYVEAKVALISVLRKVTLTLPPDMPDRISYTQENGYKLKNGSFHYPVKGLWMKPSPVGTQ